MRFPEVVFDGQMSFIDITYRLTYKRNRYGSF